MYLFVVFISESKRALDKESTIFNFWFRYLYPIYNTRFFPFKFKSIIVLASRVNASLVGKDPKNKNTTQNKKN